MDKWESQRLFERICDRLALRPDRKGEAHVDCPSCGKEAKRGQTHFSFSERGGHCFVCGANFGINQLAGLYGVTDDDVRVIRRPRPAKRPKRRGKPRWDGSALCSRYEAHPDRYDLWRAYRPLLTNAMIARARLGVGAFPRYTSKCVHERLMVPLIVNDEVVGFRGRSLGCECGKWLSPAGNRTVLYNGGRIGEGDTLADVTGTMLGAELRPLLFIVENPLDALLLEEYGKFAAVATLSVSYWKDEWTAKLQAVSWFRGVMVAFDNDRPGNGGGERGRREWMREHSRDIEPNGVKLVNRLLHAGITARLWNWRGHPYKMDMGDLLAQRYGRSSNESANE